MVASRQNTINIYGGVEKDQLFQFQALDTQSKITTQHDLVLGVEKLTVQNADGRSIDDVVDKFERTDDTISADRFAARSAEAMLGTALDYELARATAAEATLTTGLSSEVARATAEEVRIQAELDAEEARALSVETGLRTDLDDEHARAVASEDALSAGLTQEVSARVAAITQEVGQRNIAIASATDALSTYLMDVMSTKDDEIEAMVNFEKGRIDTLLQGTSIDLNQLQELIVAYTTADSSLLAQIASLTARITASEGSITTLQANTTTLQDEFSSLTDPSAV
jgi:hypothetical protein